MFREKFTRGHWSGIARTASIGPGSTIGSWARVGERVSIGQGCLIGDHSTVGDDVRLGNHVHMGPWSHIGAGARIPDHVVLGDYTRIQPGVTVSHRQRFGDFDLVTPQGVIENRSFPYQIRLAEHGQFRGEVLVGTAIGKFRFPNATEDEVEAVLQDYCWGRTDYLETFRVPEEPAPEAAADEAGPSGP